MEWTTAHEAGVIPSELNSTSLSETFERNVPFELSGDRGLELMLPVVVGLVSVVLRLGLTWNESVSFLVVLEPPENPWPRSSASGRAPSGEPFEESDRADQNPLRTG